MLSYEALAGLTADEDVFLALNPETADWVIIKREPEAKGAAHREEELMKSLEMIPGFPKHELSIYPTIANDHYFVVMNYMGCDLQRLLYHFPSLFTPVNLARMSVWMVMC